MNLDVLEDFLEELELIILSRWFKLFDSFYWLIDSVLFVDEYYVGNDLIENENESIVGDIVEDISKSDENLINYFWYNVCL